MAVVGQLDVWGQFSINLCVSAYVVAAVDKPRAASPYPAGEGYSLINGLMAVVGLLAEGIDYEHIRALDVRHLREVDGLHVSNIDE